jgi:hypothetical protein
MNSNTKYNDIEFCTNLLFNAIYGENDICYQIQPLDKQNITIEDLRKPLDYNYNDIFKGKIKFLGYYNNRIHYKVSQHFHPYEIAIGVNNLNINDINRPELQQMAFLLMCSDIVFNEKFINYTLPIMCFDIMRPEIEKFIPSFKEHIKDTKLESTNNKLYVIVTEHFLSTQTLKEYLDENVTSLTSEQLKKIIFEIFIIIAKLNERFNNFNHNNINLYSLKVCKLSKPETRKYKISGTLMENSDVDFILKLDDFDNAISTDYNFNENKDILYNPYVDINIILNHLYTFLTKYNKIEGEVEEFFNDVLPEKYRPKLDIENFNQTSNVTITSDIVLKKNKFFKNFIKMEVSVTPRNIEKLDIDNLQQKDEGILYIDYNKKNKKSNKYYSMYKGVRQIVVPGLRKNGKKDMTASEGSLFFKDEVSNTKTETSTETTVRDTMNTINPNITSSSTESETPKNKKESSSSSSSLSTTETASEAIRGTEMSATSKAIMSALAQETDKSMSRSKSISKSKKKKSSKKSKHNLKESESSSVSSSVSSVRVSEGGMNMGLSARNQSKLNKLPSNYFDLAPEGLVQEMLRGQQEGQMGAMPQAMGMNMVPPQAMGMNMVPPQAMGMNMVPPQAMGMNMVPPQAMGMMPQQNALGIEASMNNLLSGNMTGGSKDNKQQYKLNFF